MLGDILEWMRTWREKGLAAALWLLVLVVLAIFLGGAINRCGESMVEPPSPPKVDDGHAQLCERASAAFRHIEERVQPTESPRCAEGLGSAQFADVRTDAECLSARGKGRLCVVSGKASRSELLALDKTLGNEFWRDAYVTANPEFANALRETMSAKSSGLFLVRAPAGAGKSWILRSMLQKAAPSTAAALGGRPKYLTDGRNKSVMRFDDLVDWVSGDALDLDYEKGDPPLVSKLRGDPKTSPAAIAALFAAIKAEPQPLLWALDSLDEVSPEVRTAVSAQLGSLFKERPDSTVFLFGRAEGFTTGFGDSTLNTLAPAPLKLEFPSFPSVEDVVRRWNNFVIWRALLNDKDHLGVAVSENTSARDVARLLQTSSTACSSFGQLAISAFIIMNAKDWTRKDGCSEAFEQESEIQRHLLYELLRRNQDSHRRPTGEASSYFKLLELIAVNDLPTTMSLTGVFKPLLEAAHSGAPTPKELLNYSGLIDINPGDAGKYWFVPWWVPLELVRSYERRHGCIQD